MTIDDLHASPWVPGVRASHGAVSWRAHYIGPCTEDDVDRMLTRFCAEGEKLGANAIVGVEVQFDPFAVGGCEMWVAGTAVTHEAMK